MSEQLYKPGKNAQLLAEFTQKLIAGPTNKEQVNNVLTELVTSKPKDFIAAVDIVVQHTGVSPEMKKGINKMLNVFYTHLIELPQPKLKPDSFLDVLVRDNLAIAGKMNLLKPLWIKMRLT